MLTTTGIGETADGRIQWLFEKVSGVRTMLTCELVVNLFNPEGKISLVNAS